MAWFITILKILRQRAFTVLLLAVYGLSVWSFYHTLDYAPQQSWSLPDDYCFIVQFSNDNRSVLIRSSDWLAVWDVPTGTKRWEQRFEKAHVYPQYTSESLSPDGRFVSYRRCNHGSRELEQCHLIDTYSSDVVLTFRQDDRSWWEHRLLFTNDGQCVVYTESNQESKVSFPPRSSIKIWDVTSRKVRFVLPISNYQNTCMGHHHEQGDIFAVLDEEHHRIELWRLSNGQLWRSIPLSKDSRQLWRGTIWFSSNGEELFHVGAYSREEQIKSTFCAANMVSSMFCTACMVTHPAAVFSQPVGMDYNLHFAFNRGSTTETSIDCYDVMKGQIKHSNYVLYPSQDASARFLLRRTPATESGSPTVDVFDVEHGKLLVQVPGGSRSHQVDLIPHNVISGSDFRVYVSPQNNVAVVQHSSWPQPTRWEKIREWLSNWITALKTDPFATDRRDDVEACLYDSNTSQLIAKLKQREFDCFSNDGQQLATSIKSPKNTTIEIWDWPLRRPWVRILGLPVLVVLSILLLRWLFRVRVNRVLRKRNPRLV